MKILVLNRKDGTTLGDSYARAFRQLHHEVVHIDVPAQRHEMVWWRHRLLRRFFEFPALRVLHSRLVRSIAAVDADLLWIGKGDWALPELWQTIRAQRPTLKLVCYHGDNPLATCRYGGNRPWVKKSIGSFDLYCTYNQSLVGQLQAAGARRVAHIPFGWDPELHPGHGRCTTAPVEKSADVVFIGNWDRDRQPWLVAMANAARANAWQFKIYGEPASWQRCRHQLLCSHYMGQPAYGREMVAATQASQIALNILRPQNSGSHNMRTFEIPGAGGCMASQYSPEQERFFPDGEAAIYFDSVDDCIVKAEALLSDPARQRRLCSNAQEIVRHHTYAVRAQSLLEHLV